MTELEAAAYVNLTSEQYLEQLDSDMPVMMNHRIEQDEGEGTSGLKIGTSAFVVYMKKFRRSCTQLTCSSGSLYTLEKTIMLVSMHGCIQLVFNLLLTYPRTEGGD